LIGAAFGELARNHARGIGVLLLGKNWPGYCKIMAPKARLTCLVRVLAADRGAATNPQALRAWKASIESAQFNQDRSTNVAPKI